MNAKQHTDAMLRWFRAAGVDRFDLAVRRRDGAMIWHHEQALRQLPLPFARAQNVRQAEVYIRPARHRKWPVVFLDDVAPTLALAVPRKYAALVVNTSPQGGCHLWLACKQALSETRRTQAQRWLAQKTHADPASISGEHLGRLAGFKNWKRSGVWVNTNAASQQHLWDPTPALREKPAAPAETRRGQPSRRGTDTSPSGKDWLLLEAERDRAEVYHRLVERVRSRRGADTERYAQRTVERAASHVGGG